MSTVIATPEFDTVLRLLTVADVAVMPDELPSGPVKYELEEGRLIIVAPPGDIHGAAQLKVGSELLRLGELKGHGKARTETSIVVSRDPDTVFVPDAVFIATRSLPVRTSPEGYLETMPEIVVEVRSKNDSLRGLHRKAEKYLAAGVQIVWILDPQTKTVAVLAKGANSVELREADTLTAGEFIPAFSVRVADLFVV
jgi:Uma2 family endonuclease